MLSLLEVIDRTTSYFAKNGVANPRLQAEWLVAHVLDCKRLDLYLRFDMPLEETVLEQLRPLVKRRAQREPLQYITGSTPFHDLTLKCDPRALIPRPETEQLVEEILTRKPEKTTQILDLGTGTGAIALALAQALPEAKVTAVDASKKALSLAKENAEANGLANRVTFLESNWFAKVEGSFDIIASNPPYLTDEEWETAEPEVREREPKNALTAPNKGLADLEAILRQAPAFLSPGGLLALETGIAHHDALTLVAKENAYAKSESLNDFSGRPRYFLAWK